MQEILDRNANLFGGQWLALAENFYRRHDGHGCRISRIREAIGYLR